MLHISKKTFTATDFKDGALFCCNLVRLLCMDATGDQEMGGLEQHFQAVLAHQAGFGRFANSLHRPESLFLRDSGDPFFGVFMLRTPFNPLGNL